MPKAFKGVPYPIQDQPYFKQHKPFVLGFYEYLTLSGNSKRIFVQNLATDSTVTIYTVPVGKRFYLFYFELQMHNHGAGDVSGYLKINNNAFCRAHTHLNREVTEIIQSLPIPIVLNSGEIITVRSAGANCDAQGYIYGLEVDINLVENKAQTT